MGKLIVAGGSVKGIQPVPEMVIGINIRKFSAIEAIEQMAEFYKTSISGLFPMTIQLVHPKKNTVIDQITYTSLLEFPYADDKSPKSSKSLQLYFVKYN